MLANDQQLQTQRLQARLQARLCKHVQGLASGVSTLSALTSSSTNLRSAFCLSFNSVQLLASGAVSHTVNCSRGGGHVEQQQQQPIEARLHPTPHTQGPQGRPACLHCRCCQQVHLGPHAVVKLLKSKLQFWEAWLGGLGAAIPVVSQMVKHVLVQAVQLQIAVVTLCGRCARVGGPAGSITRQLTSSDLRCDSRRPRLSRWVRRCTRPILTRQPHTAQPALLGSPLQHQRPQS